MLYRILTDKYDYNNNDILESKLISDIIDSIVDIINNKSTEILGDTYIANVFKNNNKCIELEKKILEEWKIIERDDSYEYSYCESKQINLFDM